MAALLGECELLASRTCLIVLPRVLDKALVLQSLQEGVQRPALKPGEAVPTEDLRNSVAMAVALIEHREHCLRERSTG